MRICSCRQTRIEKLKFKKNLREDFIFALLDKFKYIIPQGSPMYGIGNHYSISSLSNCFVVESPCDSYGGICKTDQEIVQISKRRGGIGYDVSNLRPDKTAVTNSARTTSGATSFMHRFSNTGREVGQNGRRAAQMITISVHHPDVIKFATIKNDDISVTGANISIRLTDEFLKAVKDNKEYEQRWPVDSKDALRSRPLTAEHIATVARTVCEGIESSDLPSAAPVRDTHHGAWTGLEDAVGQGLLAVELAAREFAEVRGGLERPDRERLLEEVASLGHSLEKGWGGQRNVPFDLNARLAAAASHLQHARPALPGACLARGPHGACAAFSLVASGILVGLSEPARGRAAGVAH